MPRQEAGPNRGNLLAYHMTCSCGEGRKMMKGKPPMMGKGKPPMMAGGKGKPPMGKGKPAGKGGKGY